MKKFITVVFITIGIIICFGVTGYASSFEYEIENSVIDWDTFIDTGSVVVNFNPYFTEEVYNQTQVLSICSVVDKGETLAVATVSNHTDLLDGIIDFTFDTSELPQEFSSTLCIDVYILDVSNLTPLSNKSGVCFSTICFLDLDFGSESVNEGAYYGSQPIYPEVTSIGGTYSLKATVEDGAFEVSDGNLIINSDLTLKLETGTVTPFVLDKGNYELRIAVSGDSKVRAEVSAGYTSGVDVNGKGYFMEKYITVSDEEITEYRIPFKISSITENSVVVDSYRVNFIKIRPYSKPLRVHSISFVKLD